MSQWRKQSSAIRSLGSSADKAHSLGDLHRRREQSQGQFFTPQWVSKGIWDSLSETLSAYDVVSVLDSSVGSGSMFYGSPSHRLVYHGIDPDQRCIDALSQDAFQAGIEFEFKCGAMEDLEASGFDLAIINPPYSLHLQSPSMRPYPCTTMGAYGPNTSALSHIYALEQALEAARIVVALLPVSMLDTCLEKPELRQVVHLPSDTFNDEQACVKTAVFYFQQGERTGKPLILKASKDSSWQAFVADPLSKRQTRVFKLHGIDHQHDVITLPLTGDKRVGMHHHGRRIVLKYHCALVQAKVANALFRDLATAKRLPKSITYSGEGQLLIDVLLLQDDPHQALEALCHRIRLSGGEPVVSDTLRGYFNRCVRRHQIAITPFYRMAQTGTSAQVTLVARRRGFLDPNNINSPSVGKGTRLSANLDNALYQVSYKDSEVSLRLDQVMELFDIEESGEDSVDQSWQLIHPGLAHHFPDLAHQHRQSLSRLGIDSWLAPFQLESVVEGAISPYGYIAAWEQGSGKTRASLALCLLHSGCNMLAVESALVPELIREIERLGISDDLWKRVERHGDRPDAKINIVTYSDLRAGTATERLNIRGQSVRRVVNTNAQRWRRSINLLICDEGGLLANPHSQQTKAVKSLCARKLIVMDGTPQRGYPRDLLPLSVVSAGNACAHQRYGTHSKPNIIPLMIDTCNQSQRGEDAFYDDYVVTQWVTNQFKDDFTGAKREVPRVKNVDLYRRWLAPNIQRRLRLEPDLSVFNNCPEPTMRTHTIDWDGGHFDHYLRVATEFRHWYMKHCANSDSSTRTSNLVAVLARIGAVLQAANNPHVSSKNSMDTYMPITSKQRFVAQRVQYWAEQGRKTIVYAHSPSLLQRLDSLLTTKYGIDGVLFTGMQDVETRTRELDARFRFGDSPVLLASKVANRGLNLEQASAVIFYDRGWSSAAEKQAIYRTLRPSQQQSVEVEYCHLIGGIDEYCDQLITWKSRSALAGLDFGVQLGDDEEFMHMDTLLRQFCDDVDSRLIDQSQLVVA